MRSIAILGLTLACVATLAKTAAAASPTLSSVRPIGAQRGTEVEVVLSGARIGDAQEIMLYYPGIEVTKLEASGDAKVTATLTVAEDCRPGIHALRLRTATGVSKLLTFMVGVLPETQEKEPNNDFSAPQPIEMNVTVNGVTQPEDVDYFVIEAKKGQTITAEVEGMRLGATLYDPFVAILDTRRFELAVSDDDALVWQDGVASIVAPEDGSYIILVRESSFGGSGNSLYRLHVGDFPRPKGAFPAGGKPGETLDVQFLGDINGPFTQKVTLPSEVPAMFGLFPQTDKGMPPSPVPFRINDLDNYLEVEPNNTTAEASPAAFPGALNGVISEPGDVDLFKIPCKRGEVWDVRVYARDLRSPLDSIIRVLRANGAQVAVNDDAAGNPDSALRFTAPADEDCFISITDHLGEGGVDYIYRIEVTKVEPRVTTSLPEVRRYEDTVIAVPAGNRMAVMASAARLNVSGDLQLIAEELPEGLELQTPVMPANQSQIPLLFVADDNAKPAGALSPLVAVQVSNDAPMRTRRGRGRFSRSPRPEPVASSQPAASDAPVEQLMAGGFLQTTWLVRGGNNNLVWGHSSDRLAVVVTDAAPYSIEIVQPKVPLVRRGTMELKVKVNRQEGFNQPVQLRMLYNPAGVGSSSVVNVPADKDEGIFTLNAAAKAELRTWKIAVIGTATVGNGPLQVSSQLADLQVAESFVAFQFTMTATEQGKDADLLVKIDHLTPFEGAAKVELVGLPNEATAKPVEFTKDTKEIVFEIDTTDKTPAGRHRTLLCKVVIEQNGEPILHNLGSGELRVDPPLAPKPAVVAKEEPKPQPKPAEPAKPKPLSRLEQLRLAAEAAKKAEQAQASPESQK